MKPVLFICALTLSLSVACTSKKIKTSLATAPRVFFVEPAEGSTVTKTFSVKFGIAGMTVRPAGKLVDGTGHHHLVIDGKFVPKGQGVLKDKRNIHYGKGQSETQLTLSPGRHTLTMQFANGAHLSYGEPMSSTISVNVK